MSVLKNIFLVSHSECEVYVFLLLESWEMSVRHLFLRNFWEFQGSRNRERGFQLKCAVPIDF